MDKQLTKWVKALCEIRDNLPSAILKSLSEEGQERFGLTAKETKESIAYHTEGLMIVIALLGIVNETEIK